MTDPNRSDEPAVSFIQGHNAGHNAGDSAARFAAYLDALSTRTASDLEAQDGTLILTDASHAVQLVVELSSAQDRVIVVTPILSFPTDDPQGALAMRLLRINADRAALDGAVIAADGLRRQFVLIHELPLTLEPEDFAEAVEALMDLAAAVRVDANIVVPETAGTVALLLRRRGQA